VPKVFLARFPQVSLLTMDLYDDLASNDDGRRIKAAEQLVTKVILGEKSGIPEKGTDLTYALTRLVKGLSSGRESARLGFGMALTEVRSCKAMLM
jgi:DNA polymerase phi